jgi:hypothetical protein
MRAASAYEGLQLVFVGHGGEVRVGENVRKRGCVRDNDVATLCRGSTAPLTGVIA